MELTTICVTINIWLCLSIVMNVITAFINWLADDDDGFGWFITLIFTCLCLAFAVTYILLEKGVI